jgi:TM2 domain-containing membrane protein YozV
MGIDLLRQQSRTDHVPYVKKRTSPVIATFLSFICPGLGAAYNGQTVKALVYFAVFAGLFQMAVLTSGAPLFVLGFIGMWFFAAVDSWRTASMIRSGLTPDVADDILVKRFSGNPRLWGIVLLCLGGAFVLQRVFNLGFLMRGLVPLMLIGLGIYILRGYIFKPKDETRWANTSPSTSFALTHPRYSNTSYQQSSEFSDRTRSGAWRDI